MVGVKEICALLLAGGVGAGSVVTVQQAAPALKKVARPAATAQASAPVRKPVRHAAAGPSALNDCPSMVGILGKDMALPPLPPIEVAPGLSLGQTAMAVGSGVGIGTPGGLFPSGPSIPGSGGGGGGGGIAVVPEAGTWAMLIAGFGLVGLAMRRGGRKSPDPGADG